MSNNEGEGMSRMAMDMARIIDNKGKHDNCIHCMSEAVFDWDSKTGERDIYGDPKVAHSFIGIWKNEFHGMCYKYQNSDEQFKARGGFFFCDEKRQKDCLYYQKK